MASKQTKAALTVTRIIQQRKKSDIVDDATSRQKVIATSTKSLSKHVEAFIVIDVIGLTAENHVG